MLENKLNVLVYAGEFDMKDGPSSIYPWLTDIKELTEKDPYFFQRARQFYFTKDTNGKQIVGGYYRASTTTNFTFLTVPKAGHFVPTNYLKPTL